MHTVRPTGLKNRTFHIEKRIFEDRLRRMFLTAMWSSQGKLKVNLNRHISDVIWIKVKFDEKNIFLWNTPLFFHRSELNK
jgi:hypothetical protein